MFEHTNKESSLEMKKMSPKANLNEGVKATPLPFTHYFPIFTKYSTVLKVHIEILH